MARNLYRFYLYAVYIALLIFAAIAAGQLLGTVLLLTPLRASYDAVPSQARIVQAVVFALVSWIIAGLLGGLHYWLIRRDIQSDPAAGTSAIRSFFLNITEAIGIAIAVPVVGFFVLGPLGLNAQYNVVSAASFALPALALVVVLELERRRTQARPGAAMAFQRLHFYGVQLLFLLFLSSSWQSSASPLIDGILLGGRGLHEICSSNSGNCPNYNLFFLAASILWFVLFWVGYGWLIRRDKSAVLRFILHFFSLAVGVGFILTSVYRAATLALLPSFGTAIHFRDVVGPGAQYNFASFLTLGILVIGVYHLWFSMASRQGLIERKTMHSTEYAIAAVLSAIAFWWGSAYVMYNTLQRLTAAAPDARSWITSIALIVAGIGYIPLDLYLWRRNNSDPNSAAGPRRGFVLAVLGGGILALAIGGASALYAWATSLFGSPISNWQQAAQIGLSAFAVGVIIVAVYLQTTIREHLLKVSTKRPAPAVAASVPSVPVVPAKFLTLEDVLDELLAGKITREEAAARIRSLDNTPVSASNHVS